jgi:hypothetical protein
LYSRTRPLFSTTRTAARYGHPACTTTPHDEDAESPPGRVTINRGDTRGQLVFGQILTVVSGTVEPDREDDLTAAYRRVLAGVIPDGLLASALLRGDGHRWQISTLWRDRAALDAMLAAMRVSVDVPSAPQVFRAVGADPTLTVFEVTDGLLRT